MKIAVFHFSLFGINSYVVWDENTHKCAIIDPGMINDRERKALTDFIERENLQVEHLINTHLHVDHAIGNHFVESEYGVDVEAHPEDAFLGKRLADQLREFGISAGARNTSIGIELENGDEILIGEGKLRVIHVPGHSPGGIALYDEEGGFLISGDSLFAGSVGRTDLPGGDQMTLLKAIHNKLLTLPDQTIVYPGHGEPTTIGTEKVRNPFLV